MQENVLTKKKGFFSLFIGDRAFYRRVLTVAVPIIIQSLVTSLVNVLDNVMVGRLGTEAMSGVSIVNQFMFVYNLLIFGAVSGAGIFTAQFFGKGDTNGVRDTFRTKIVLCTVASVAAILLLYFAQDGLIGSYLHEGSEDGDIALTLQYGKEYLFVMLFGLLPYALTQAYASTLRETNKNMMPMVASLVAVATNFIFNLLLIFGLLGFPRLGCVGAAIATVISRFAELLILVVYTHSKKSGCTFIEGAYRSLRIPRSLLASIAVKGLPLMLNELFYSLAITFRNQCYSTRGLDAVAAQNIASTITNLFSVVFLSLGQAVAIIIGNRLGEGKIDLAIDESRKMRAFSLFSGVVIGGLLAATSWVFPLLYVTSDRIRDLATFMMIVFGICMPFFAYMNASYFTIRSGGKVFITICCDSGFMWAILIPVSVVLAYLTPIDIRTLYVLSSATEALKAVFGFVFVYKTKWAHKIID